MLCGLFWTHGEGGFGLKIRCDIRGCSEGADASNGKKISAVN